MKELVWVVSYLWVERKKDETWEEDCGGCRVRTWEIYMLCDENG